AVLRAGGLRERRGVRSPRPAYVVVQRHALALDLGSEARPEVATPLDVAVERDRIGLLGKRSRALATADLPEHAPAIAVSMDAHRLRSPSAPCARTPRARRAARRSASDRALARLPAPARRARRGAERSCWVVLLM